MSKTSRDVKPFGVVIRFLRVEKKTPFLAEVSGIQIMDENSRKVGWISKKTRSEAVESPEHENCSKPGWCSIIVVGSKGFWEWILILFTYYNTEDSEWMNHQANKPTWAEHVTMCKQNLSNPTLVEK